LNQSAGKEPAGQFHSQTVSGEKYLSSQSTARFVHERLAVVLEDRKDFVPVLGEVQAVGRSSR